MKRKFLSLLLVALLVASVLMVPACSNNNDDPTPPAVTNQSDPAPTPAQTTDNNDPATETPEAPARDLGGMVITIGNWWGGYDTDTYEPNTLEGEARLLDRIYIQERYNFTMREVQLGGWGEIQELATMSIIAGDPAASIFILQPDWFAAMNAQGMFAPLDFVDFADTTDYTWNQTIIDATRVNGVPYGWTREIQQGGGVFYNMRLFEEAGLDRYLPFDLQARGEWTWDKFVEISHQLTRDINNDGINDTWAMATFSSDILPLALASNRAQYIGRDENGNFYNATNTPQFMEALSFVNSLQHEIGILMPQPPDSEWNWFDHAFHNGQVAMRTSGEWAASGINDNLDDDFGFVTFPVGPSGDTHRFMGNANVFCIPSTFSPEEVEAIMFAYMLWQRPLPGFDDPDGWKAGRYLVHSTPRSVDETIALFSRDGSRMSPAFHGWIPAFEEGPNFSWRMWHEGSDPAQIVEEAQQRLNEWIADANNR